jgi:FkbM family methyltransferase
MVNIVLFFHTSMRSLLYRFIYHPTINYALRNINKIFSGLFGFKLPPSGVLKIKLRNNSVIRLHTNQSDFVSYCVFWNGLYGYEYTEIFEDIIGKCRGFIDIGSNTGLYSLIGVSTNKLLKVIAFDPTDSAAHYFTKNLEENNASKNIFFHQLAVADQSGDIVFFKVRNPKYPQLRFNLGGSSGFVEKPEYYDELKVKKIKLDDFLEKNHPGFAVDFVKIDAENAEPMIIDGMRGIIQTHKPIIVCEVMFDQVIDELERAFQGLGYAFYFHVDRKLVRVESLKQKKEFKDVRNCFFVPQAKIELISNWIGEKSQNT